MNNELFLSYEFSHQTRSSRANPVTHSKSTTTCPTHKNLLLTSNYLSITDHQDNFNDSTTKGMIFILTNHKYEIEHPDSTLLIQETA